MTLSLSKSIAPVVGAFVLFGLLWAGFASAQIGSATSCRLRANVSASEAQELTGNPAAVARTGGVDLDLTTPSTAGENALICSYGFIKWMTRILFVVILAVAVLLLGWASFLFVTAGQDPTKAGRARMVIIWAVVGLMVAAVAYLIPNIARGLLVN